MLLFEAISGIITTPFGKKLEFSFRSQVDPACHNSFFLVLSLVAFLNDY